MRRPTHATPVAAPALRHAHWRALDGLRGVAVLTVLAGHLFEDVKHPNVLVRGVLGALHGDFVNMLSPLLNALASFLLFPFVSFVMVMTHRALPVASADYKY